MRSSIFPLHPNQLIQLHQPHIHIQAPLPNILLLIHQHNCITPHISPFISHLSMFSSILLQLALAIGHVASSPIQRRALSQNDIIGLQLASYLENLELSLYTGGCEGITDVQWIAAGFPSTFQQDICAIAEVSSSRACILPITD
jgi:hypothetical protein